MKKRSEVGLGRQLSGNGESCGTRRIREGKKRRVRERPNQDLRRVVKRTVRKTKERTK